MNKLIKTATIADVIVNGYAFTKVGSNVRVLNLNKMDRAAFISNAGEVLETSMDDIELDIVLDYYKRNSKYMEEK